MLFNTFIKSHLQLEQHKKLLLIFFLNLSCKQKSFKFCNLMRLVFNQSSQVHPFQNQGASMSVTQDKDGNSGVILDISYTVNCTRCSAKYTVYTVYCTFHTIQLCFLLLFILPALQNVLTQPGLRARSDLRSQTQSHQCWARAYPWLESWVVTSCVVSRCPMCPTPLHNMSRRHSCVRSPSVGATSLGTPGSHPLSFFTWSLIT